MIRSWSLNCCFLGIWFDHMGYKANFFQCNFWVEVSKNVLCTHHCVKYGRKKEKHENTIRKVPIQPGVAGFATPSSTVHGSYSLGGIRVERVSGSFSVKSWLGGASCWYRGAMKGFRETKIWEDLKMF